MTHKIFVDGQAGTTGLEIGERLAARDDIELLEIDPALRKDRDERQRLIDASDITFLCLPDDASRESVGLCTSDTTRFIDASTAFRTADGWDYGIPELSSAHRAAIASSKRVSNPGCHASGFVLPIYPLVTSGMIAPDYPFSCYSLTGYSGGGKALIEAYQAAAADDESLNGPRHYALALAHKHLPEMSKACGLSHPPLFAPIVGRFYRGMVVSIPLHTRLIAGQPSAQDLHAALSQHYAEEHFVEVLPFDLDANLAGGFLDATTCNHTNRLQLMVAGHADQVMLISRLDNLGKGASGAAIQNMNIMLGLDETTGLAA
jgi:N-acetyl-gamma-glutamyl-phosphate reductase